MLLTLMLLNLGLLLGTEAPVTTPNGVDFSFLFFSFLMLESFV